MANKITTRWIFEPVCFNIPSTRNRREKNNKCDDSSIHAGVAILRRNLRKNNSCIQETQGLSDLLLKDECYWHALKEKNIFKKQWIFFGGYVITYLLKFKFSYLFCI